MAKVANFNGIEIIVRTRDEHCPPHVHAFHTGERWELKIYFSFVTSNIVGCKLHSGCVPQQKVVQRCLNKVTDNLDKARQLYWQATRTVCLDNQYIEIVNGEVRSADPKSLGALKVKVAKYDINKKSLEVTAQGRTQTIAGKCP